MSNHLSPLSSWKDFFLNLAADPNYTGSSLSSIKNASLTFSTSETLRFLETDPGHVLLTDDDGNSLLIFHHFQSISSPVLKNESTLVAIACVDPMATPVIINTSSIKNYSQLVPSSQTIKTISSQEEFQNITSGLETITLRNAIVIPLQLLKVILSTDNHSPDHLAIEILQAMHQLDLTHNPTNSLQILILPTNPSETLYQPRNTWTIAPTSSNGCTSSLPTT
jgi:hypothetical protein